MKITQILAVSAFGVLLSACGSQQQVEGSSAAMAGKGAKHVHNVEGHGDHTHQHSGNSTENHGHSWNYIQNEINP